MKQQEVFKKIGTILQELTEQYQYLSGCPADLNDLELELFVANAHFLAEHSQVLRKLNQQNTRTAVQEPQSPKRQASFFEPVARQAERPAAVAPPVTPPEPPLRPAPAPASPESSPVPHIDLSSGDQDEEFSVMRRDEPPVIKHELVLDESQNWEDEEDEGFKVTENEEEPSPGEPEPAVKPAENAMTPPPEPHVAARPAVSSAPATVTDEPLTVNQAISASLTKGSRVSEQFHPPVSDLKQAISLNDKLLYIKDLFNGYNLAYSEAIDILNRMSTFAEAEHFLKNTYATKNHWDEKPATSEKFFALVRRRYA